MSGSDARRVRVARAVYRALLVIAPRATRREYGADMRATFEGLSREASAQGAWRLAALVARECRDLAGARRSAIAAAVRRAAERSLTMVTGVKRMVRLGEWRQCARSLWRRPVFAAAAVVTLALGIGATTALFSVVDTILIKPLPYPAADRLVTVYEASSSSREKASLIAPPRLADWRRMNRTLSALSGQYAESVTDTSGADPERLDGRRVLPDFFTVFAAAPLAGRTFTAAEEAFNGPAAAVIGEGLWTRRYGRDPGAVGRTLRIGGRPYLIVGVMPETFASTPVDVWLPAQLSPQFPRDARFISGVGRMKADVSIEQAQSDVARVQDELAAAYPKTDKGWSATLHDLKDARVGDRRGALWLLFGAVVLLWVIAIANVAGLVLVHVRRRRRELAIRTAIGASRARVVALVMQEVLLVAAVGGAIGAAVAAWILQIVRSSFPTLPRVAELGLDWRALAFGVCASGTAALGCGLLPALQATRRRPAYTLAHGGRAIGGDPHRLQRALVAGQVALSVLLCTSAALLVRSYYNLVHVSPGFSTDGVITFHVGARWDEDRGRVGQFQEQLVAELGRMPGVRAVGLTNFLPARAATLRYQVAVDGLAGPDVNGMMTVGSRTVGAGYLQALQAPLATGQWCPEFRVRVGDAPFGALVNRRFVERFAPGQSLVGRQLHFDQMPTVTYTILGVVGDLAEDGPGAEPVPYVYSCATAGAWPDPEYVIRASDTRAVLANLRRVVRTIDASRAVFGVQSLEDVLGRAVDEPRMNASVISTFAATAITLAAIGLYGLFTLLVSETRRELGVRLALGATPGQLVGLVLAGAGRLVVTGIFAGLVLTFSAQRLWRALLFGVGSLDAITVLAATLTLVAVSTAAIAVPAVRASRVAPTEALRGD